MRTYDTLGDWATNNKRYGYIVKVMSVLPVPSIEPNVIVHKSVH